MLFVVVGCVVVVGALHVLFSSFSPIQMATVGRMVGWQSLVFVVLSIDSFFLQMGMVGHADGWLAMAMFCCCCSVCCVCVCVCVRARVCLFV